MTLKNTYRKICILIVLTLILCGCATSCIRQDDAPPFVPPDVESKKYPTIIIDAGHGGEDGGAVGKNGVYEKDLNLKIALELKAMLDAKGIPTRLTRTDDTLLYDRNVDYQGRKKALDMAARLAIVEEYENAVFVSIHMNSFPQSQYSGIQVYYSENNSKSLTLARLLQSFSVTNLQPDNTRKVKPSSGSIYLLEKIEHPAVLIECGFLSNDEECRLLCTDEYRSRLCMTLCSALINYFDSCGNSS